MSRKTRKLMWAAPLMAAFAVVGALALFMALAPDPARADHVDLPGIVTGVTATADGRDTINVKWKAPDDGGAVAYYRIDRSMNGIAWMRLERMHTGSTSYTDTTGLKPEMSYHYRVFAVNSAGSGPSSDLGADNMATTAMAAAPGPVRMLTATPMGPNQINLSWYPPTDNGGANILRYCISTWPAGATVPTDATTPVNAGPTNTDNDPADATECLADTTPTTLPAANAAEGEGVIVVRAPAGAGKVEFMHKSLPHNHARHYQVYAVNSKGWSTVPSRPNPQPRTAQAGKPSAPTLRITRGPVGAGNIADADFWLTWPEDDGGAPISGWDVDTKVGTAAFTNTGAFHNLELNGLGGKVTADAQCGTCTAGDNLTTVFRVRFQSTISSTEVKEGEWSNTQTITVTGGEVQGPDAPPLVAELEATEGKHLRQIDLSWKKEPGVGYVIDYREAIAEANIDDDASDGGDVNAGRWMKLQPDTGYSEGTYRHHGLKPGTSYMYRVFPIKQGRYAAPMIVTGMTKAATKPSVVTELRTSSDDPTMIKVEWDKPAVEGGEAITGYRVEISSTAITASSTATAVTHPDDDCPASGVCAREIMGADNTMFTLGGLNAGEDWWFRVFAINKVFKDDTSAPDLNDRTLARPKKGTSAKAGTPAVPVDLTAQPARDANINDAARLGVDILWNAPDDPVGDVVTGYVIERRTKANAAADWTAWDTDWKMVEMVGGDAPRTSVGDTQAMSGLAAGEMRQYRVKAKSGEGTGPMTDAVTYPASNMAIPSAPQMVMAAKSADMPTSKVKVSWQEPAMNADDVTGYIIERKHPGDGVGAIPADGYNDDVMGRDHAFKNYKEWWETLNCKGMLRVAGSNADPAVDSADKTMYCKHFLDTYPTKIPDNTANADKAISEATAMKVKALFMKRYVSDDMGMTKTMFTGMMHYDAGLRANTEYTYRVRAIHGMKAGAWSAGVMVMTGNNDPMAEGSIADVTVAAGATTEAMDVSGYFSDADNDALTYVAASDDDDIATADIPAGSNMLTIRGVAAGTATIRVTASDNHGGTADQEIGVTVTTGITELTAPTNVKANAVERDGDPGIQDVVVTWTDGMNATQHAVILFDSNWEFDTATDLKTGPTDGRTTFRGVASGAYTAVVVALDDDFEMALDADAVTVP